LKNDVTKSQPAAMRRFRLTVAYDGTAYAGWQCNPAIRPCSKRLRKRWKSSPAQP